MAISYGLEKFFTAVNSLATSTLGWKDRLFNAFMCIHMVDPTEDLPSDLQQRYIDLRNALTHIEAKKAEGTIKATIAQMEEEEGRRLMVEIHSIYEELRTSEES